MSKWSDGSDRACANFTKFANLQKDRLGYLCLMIGGHCLFRSLLFLLEHWNSQELAGTRRDSQELAGTRREHWNSQELAGTRRIFGTLEHWYSAVAWPPGLADGRRRWQSRVEAWYTWHRMVEWQSRRDRAVTGGGGGRGTSMGERGKLEK